MKSFIVTFHRTYEITEQELSYDPDLSEEELKEEALDIAWKALIDEHEEFLHDITDFVSYTIETKE